MGLYRMGPPTGLILALQRQLGIDDFVETGTYWGDAAATARFQAQPKVRVLFGDSGATRFWLDARRSGLSAAWATAASYALAAWPGSYFHPAARAMAAIQTRALLIPLFGWSYLRR